MFLDDIFNKLLPEDPEEVDKVTPMRELFQDLKAMGAWLYVYLSASVILSTFLSGFFYQYVTTLFSDKNLYLFASFRYGLSKSILLTLVLLILFLAFGFKGFRSMKKNYLMNYRDNYLKSKNETFGGSHFQTDEELEKNFEITDSIEETTGYIFGMKDEKIYSFIYPPGMNYNRIYFGSPGSGKSAAIIKTDIYQAIRRGESIVCTDTKGDLYAETSAVARKYGYKVRVLNLKPTEFKNSDSFNILATLKKDDPMLDAKADVIANVIISNTSAPEEREDYWAKNEFNLFKCVAMHIATDESHIVSGTNTLPEMFNFLSSHTAEELKFLGQGSNDSPIVQCYKIFANTEPRNQGQILNGAAIRLSKLTNKYLQKALSFSEIDPIEPMKKKCIYYVIISDTDDSYKFISSLFFSILFIEQCNYSDCLLPQQKAQQKTVHYLLDEYRATGGINGLPIRIATLRSRKIGLCIILQDKGQLDTIYTPQETSTILNCCTVKGLLSTNDDVTAEYFSTLLGEETVISESNRFTEDTADIIHAKNTVQKTYSENKRSLLGLAELLNGKLERDEMIYVISSMPPVKLKKCFAEKAGEAIHPLEKESRELGIKKPHRHKPKWRKLEEEKKAQAQMRVEEANKQLADPEDKETKDGGPDKPRPSQKEKAEDAPKKQYAVVKNPSLGKRTEKEGEEKGKPAPGQGLVFKDV